jgi:hypothetical protein
MDNDKAFGEITIDKSTRQKIYDSISKPVYTDPETGQRLTAIQKYESENHTEFLKNVGMLFVLTDGFKNIDKLVKDRVKKETRSKVKDLENVLSRGNSISNANLHYASGVSEEEPLFKGWKLSV